jgi:hypothetical protein
MLRIITSLIRNAPGPLKGARAMAADFIEGIIDVVRPPADIDQPPPPRGRSVDTEGGSAKSEAPKADSSMSLESTASAAPKASVLEEEEPAEEATPSVEDSEAARSESADADVDEPKESVDASRDVELDAVSPTDEQGEPAESVSGDLEEAFRVALGKASWVRKQEFKVLAIYWEARRRALGPITAKNGSSIGEELGLEIRHENIRKVIRTRLVEQIETTKVAESQPPTYQFEMTDEGVRYFVDEYLSKT